MTKIFLLFLLSLSMPSLAMKRQKTKEPKTIKKLKKTTAQEEKSAFEKLPAEIKVHILSFLVTAPGSTKTIRLNTAAENIRNFMIVNKEMHGIIQDVDITGYLIRELAKRYTDNNIVTAALALRTVGAGLWLQKNSDAGLQHDLGLKFIYATQQNQLAELSFIVKYFPHLVNKLDSSGRTALYIAVYKENTAIVELFLKVPGIDVNTINIEGDTALIIASFNGNESIVQLLLNAPNINVNVQNKYGITALYTAVGQGHLATVERLLSVANININLQLKDGTTPLMIAVVRNYPAIVRLLLTMPTIDVNKANQDGATALFFAIIKGNLEMVKLLLECERIAINYREPSGYTALKMAQESNIPNKDEIIKLLKEHGAVE